MPNNIAVSLLNIFSYILKYCLPDLISLKYWMWYHMLQITIIQAAILKSIFKTTFCAIQIMWSHTFCTSIICYWQKYPFTFLFTWKLSHSCPLKKMSHYNVARFCIESYFNITAHPQMRIFFYFHCILSSQFSSNLWEMLTGTPFHLFVSCHSCTIVILMWCMGHSLCQECG